MSVKVRVILRTFNYYDYLQCLFWFNALNFKGQTWQKFVNKHLKKSVLQEMAMRKVTRTLFEEEDDDMVRGNVLITTSIYR